MSLSCLQECKHTMGNLRDFFLSIFFIVRVKKGCDAYFDASSNKYLWKCFENVRIQLAMCKRLHGYI